MFIGKVTSCNIERYYIREVGRKKSKDVYGDIRSYTTHTPLALHLNNADIHSYYIGRDDVTGWTTTGGASGRGLFQGEHYPVAERIARQGLYLPFKHYRERQCKP
jgi:hypothetical protein